MAFIIVMKQHGALKIDTQFFGPYATFDEAYDALGTVPTLYGQGGRAWPADLDDIQPDDGFRYIAELESGK